jgi:Xaa-Pro aminopeptidase
MAGYSRLWSGPGALIVLADGESILIVPRYEVAAARARADVSRVEGYGDGGFGLDLAPGERLGEACAELLPIGRIAVACDVPGADEQAFASGGERVGFEATMRSIRLLKDVDECRLIARAYELSLAGQSAVAENAQLGSREIDLYTAAFARAQTEAGAPIEFGGDMLVGERSALVCGPVAVPGPCRVQESDVIVSDLSVRHDGYWGDTARTFIVGRHDDAERAREFIGGVLERAAGELRPGVPAADIYANMHAAITDRYRDASFPHHGGHGLGVTVFEDPHLIPADQALLREGMVIAVEPGVYQRGRFGVRTENVYVVTEDGGIDLLSLYGS